LAYSILKIHRSTQPPTAEAARRYVAILDASELSHCHYLTRSLRAGLVLQVRNGKQCRTRKSSRSTRNSRDWAKYTWRSIQTIDTGKLFLSANTLLMDTCYGCSDDVLLAIRKRL